MALVCIGSLLCLLVYSAFAKPSSPVQPGSSITELGDNSFAEFAKNKDFLMVDFYAPWCSDSKALAPELDKAVYTLGNRGTHVAKVDCFGRGKKLCESFGIRHWPTLKSFRHGIFTADYNGAHHAEAVANYVNGAEDIIEDTNGFSNSDSTTGAVTASAKDENVFSLKEKPVKSAAPASVSSSSSSSSNSGSSSGSNSGSTSSSSSPVDKKTVTEEESSTSESVENDTPVAAAKEDSPVSVQPQQAIASLGSLPKIQAASNAVVVPQISPPSAEVVNMLECAKCNIMTPAQQQMTQTCRAYKRSCLPHLSQNSSKRQKVKYSKRSHKRSNKKHTKKI